MNNTNDTPIAAPALDGHALAEWRERMGYSPSDAATLLGVPQSQWDAWERDAERIPRMVGLAMAALALGMEPYSNSK